ncbi:DUF4044 domain-containing protein [Lactobacillus panisapium]|nr:DUF4044 domain-containing protein [Lactobacillus panisapium]QYN54576.1 DUF4044 domain-containing protein [Lactobacillus panisapium]QYN58509.1 DUF4044 domain-containing protein [Lactobacillus panisapium]
MARKHRKKKSGFERLTIFMAWLMAIITLAAVLVNVLMGLGIFE